MACHVLDPVYSSLKLGYPDKVRGSSTSINTESAPQAETVEFSFPVRDNMPKSPCLLLKYTGMTEDCSQTFPTASGRRKLMADGSRRLPVYRFERYSDVRLRWI